MRYTWAVLPILILAGCAPSPAPNTKGVGVGFGDYDAYLAERAAREQALRRGIQPGLVVSPEIAPYGSTPAGNPVQATISPAQTVDAQPSQVASAGTAPAQPIDPNNPTISDEQNFQAVSARESIESDRERLERQKEQFVVIEPTALPRRRGGSDANIVAYALSTNNAVGQKLYPRGPFENASVSARNCAKYVSADLAQEAFLAAGGPKKDPKRLDPDGDGFACGWNPAPFRVVRR